MTGKCYKTLFYKNVDRGIIKKMSYYGETKDKMIEGKFGRYDKETRDKLSIVNQKNMFDNIGHYLYRNFILYGTGDKVRVPS